jgi:Helix-hairpin-helix motif
VSSAIGSANGVNLNKANPEQLEKVGGLGRERAERIVRQRPFDKWEDLKRIEGFSDKLVNDLKNSGATL